jgi:multiple sugar transport system permease protein
VTIGRASRRRAATSVRLAILALGAIVMVVPFAWLLSTSFKPDSIVLQSPPQLLPHHATVANYTGAWGTNEFGRYFFNSVLVSVVSTAAAVLLAAMMAFAFARFNFRGRSVLFALVLVGLMVPTMMLLIPQFLLAKKLMLLNSLWGLIVFYTGGNLALDTFLLRSFFQDIPHELEEAMVVDGAGPWSRFWRLIVPLSRPAIATVAIFTFVGAWDEFTWALTIINDSSKRTLPLGIALFQGEHVTSWGLLFAASAIAIVPVIAIFAAFQRHFVGGLTAGALKG